MHVQSAKKNHVILFDLHEHPGGPDGGEFPDSQEIEIQGNTVLYTPGPPDDASFDNFDDFVLADDKDALEKLVRDQVKSMRDEADILEELANSIRDCTEFVLVGEEDDEEDEEDDEEEEEYDEEDEDEEEEEDEEE